MINIAMRVLFALLKYLGTKAMTVMVIVD